MYGTLVVAYLFLGGAAGGAFLVMAVWSLILHRSLPHRSGLKRNEFRILRGRVYAAALILLAGAMLCLLADLYYPERALLVFIQPRLTPLTFGAYSLAALLLIGTLLTLASLFHERFPGRVKQTLEVLCTFAAIFVMGYTGIFLYSNAGIPFWHTFALIGLFFFSALSSGLSATLLIDYFSRSETRLVQATRPLQACHLVCLAVELGFMAAFVVAAWSNPQATMSVSLLLSDAILPTALVGALGLGILVPFALETYALLRKEQRTIPVSDFVCLIGAFCLRWTVIVCGVH